MVTTTLAASALFSFLAATVYSLVGWRLSLRKVSSQAQLAAALFTVWWFGLALSTALGGVQTGLGAGGLLSLPLAVTATYVNLAILCVALFGLLYYLLFLFTGRYGLFVPLALFYGPLYALLVYYITLADPVGVQLNRWNVTLLNANNLSGTLFFAVILLLLVLPILLGALAYFTLFFRVRDRTLRYRIGVVSWALILWFGTTLVATAGGLSTNDSWQLVSRALGLSAAVAILVAYEPPRFLKRRLGVSSVSDEPPPSTASQG